MTLAEQAKAALDAAFAMQIEKRFDAFNAWVTSGKVEQQQDGDPTARFRRSMRELKAAYEAAHCILDEIFGALS